MIGILVVRMLKQHKRQSFHQFSKLHHFLKSYQTESSGPLVSQRQSKTQPTTSEKFTSIMQDLKQGKSYQFNTNLGNYLSQGQINIDQLLQLLQTLYQTNMFCNKLNKENILQAMKAQDYGFNEKSIAIGQYGFQLGICDQQILNNFVNSFLQCNIEQLNSLQKFDIIFVLAQAMKKYNINQSDEQFQKQWKKIIFQIKKEAKNAESPTLLKKYPHLAFIIKVALQEQKQNEFIFGDLKELFQNLTFIFLSENWYSKLEPKEITILLSSIIKIKERKILVKEMAQIMDQLLSILQKNNLQIFNDHSLSSIALSLSNLPNNQSQLCEALLFEIEERIKKDKFHPKFHLSILYEIYFKWSIKIPRKHLINIMHNINIQECSDFDLAHYFALLTLLPVNDIDQLLKIIKTDLTNRSKRQEESKVFRDQISIERIRKSLERISNMLISQEKNLDDHKNILQWSF